MPNTVNYNPNTISWGDDDDTFNEPKEGEEVVSEQPVAEVSTEEQSETPEAIESVNGVSLEDLDSEDEPAKTVEPVKEEQPVGYEQFASDFKKYIGVDLNGAKQMLAELQAFRVQTIVEKQQGVLKSKWGDAYDERFAQVTEYFQKLSPAKQQALDNPEGAELIWAKISADTQKQESSKQPKVPNFVSGKTTTTTNRSATNSKQVLNYSDILAMSPKEYRSRQKEIQLAFEEGRVHMDNDSDSPF